MNQVFKPSNPTHRTEDATLNITATFAVGAFDLDSIEDLTKFVALVESDYNDKDPDFDPLVITGDACSEVYIEQTLLEFIEEFLAIELALTVGIVVETNHLSPMWICLFDSLNDEISIENRELKRSCADTFKDDDEEVETPHKKCRRAGMIRKIS